MVIGSDYYPGSRLVLSISVRKKEKTAFEKNAPLA
jgi:hypothetical protein